MNGPMFVLWLFFGSTVTTVYGFQDKPGCEELRATMVKEFRPTRSACLSVDFRTRPAKQPEQPK